MKQKLSLVLALALALSLAACGNQAGGDGSTPPAVIAPSTPYPQYAHAEMTTLPRAI